MDVVTLIVGSLLGVGAGFAANGLFARYQRRASHHKQAEFIAKLHATLNPYAEHVPSDEADVVTRREIVKQRVRELSGEIFGTDVPPFESFRLEETQYPEIACRWCHRGHQPRNGSRGECRHCHLPFDIWISCQVDECPYCKPQEVEDDEPTVTRQ